MSTMSNMPNQLTPLAHRLERAQALQNERFTLASGGVSLPLGGGFALFRGEGHPLNEALGLTSPITEDELIQAESLLSRGNHPVSIELSPGADPTLWPLLAQRGYRVQEFQQLLTRTVVQSLPTLRALDDLSIILATDADSDRFSRVVSAGFCGIDDWHNHEPLFSAPAGIRKYWRLLALIGDEPAGAASLCAIDDVALFSGDSTLPRFRGRGVQRALIRERLRLARGAGCEIACASTLPHSSSQRAYESSGFKIAYPKIVMVRG